MNDKNIKNFFLGTLLGVFLSVTAIVVFLDLPANSSNSPKEISFDQAISLIENKKIKEAHFRQPIKITEQPQHNGLNLFKALNFLIYSIIAFCLIFSLYKYLNSRTKNKDLD